MEYSSIFYLLQKKAIFGVLKAQGSSNGYLSRMVFAQTFILAILAVSLGLALTLLSAVFLPTSVPFQVNPLFFAGISVLMVLIAVFVHFLGGKHCQVDALRQSVE